MGVGVFSKKDLCRSGKLGQKAFLERGCQHFRHRNAPQILLTRLKLRSSGEY